MFYKNYYLIRLRKIYGFFLLIANFIKRFLYVLKRILIYTKNSIKWLFSSKEHTSFSIEMDEIGYNSFISQFLYFTNLKREAIEEKVEFARSLNMRDVGKTLNPKMIDVDLKPRFDHRLISFILLFENSVKYLIEFGFNQGRLLFLIDEYIKKNKIRDKHYIGIDYNHRKGGLLENIHESEEYKVLFQDIKDFLLKDMDKDLLREGLIVSSTHEINSETFLFNFLWDNNIFPKFIISTNVNIDSPYRSFLSKAASKYKNETFIFLDKNEFLEPIRIGLSIRI